jgi:hypothetical protein
MGKEQKAKSKVGFRDQGPGNEQWGMRTNNKGNLCGFS